MEFLKHSTLVFIYGPILQGNEWFQKLILTLDTRLVSEQAVTFSKKHSRRGGAMCEGFAHKELCSYVILGRFLAPPTILYQEDIQALPSPWNSWEIKWEDVCIKG